MKRKFIGKVGKTIIYGTNMDDYFEKHLKTSPAARAGYDEEVMKNLVGELNRALVKEHITQYALAKRAGIRPQVVKRILNGAPNAEVNTISKMGESMNMQLSWEKK
jgi:DNA-binding XRE family transcriptional regulator